MSTISANQDLFVDLNETDAETISGGYEVFTIRNKTNYNINYYVDGQLTQPQFAKPGSSSVWTAYNGGIIKFDKDGRNNYTLLQTYNLENGRVYEFQDNTSTPGNPYDIELYSVA